MHAEQFCSLAQRLTGTPVKNLTARDRSFLEQVLSDSSREISCAQFNELLLLVSKDRVEQPFFNYFFGRATKVSSLAEGVERFQEIAMLAYGNFIFAYRRLSRIKSEAELRKILAELPIGGDVAAAGYLSRSPKLIDIEPISRDDTYLIGYLSAKQLVTESRQGSLLLACSLGVKEKASWEDLITVIKNAARESEWPSLLNVVDCFRKRGKELTVTDFRSHLQQLQPQVAVRERELGAVQQVAIRNQDVYLTWDEMDVYFATSMRKPWEYTDLFDFISRLMSDEGLKKLNLRYFDPTQSYAPNREDKGLVESLMLKRAKCTVYSVQDTDTLGKDSELAATLAQGKPVIAYVPYIDPARRMNELRNEDPLTVLDRLRFVLYTDDRLSTADLTFLRDFSALNECCESATFSSVRDNLFVNEFRQKNGQGFDKTCSIIANAEQRIYDKRATTLKDFHPLGLQVNLDTGVANGVLVVRDLEKCAKLLHSVLTRSMTFTIEEAEGMWYLREVISESIFRIVTRQTKVSNCFWNFYLREYRG